MCIKGKQVVKHKKRRAFFATIRVVLCCLVTFFFGLGAVLAGVVDGEAQPTMKSLRVVKPVSAVISGAVAGVVLGDNLGGLIDRVYVSGPPEAEFAMSVERGSFLDCGSGVTVARTDDDGRRMVALVCGVTLAETLVIPTTSQPAKLTIHY